MLEQIRLKAGFDFQSVEVHSFFQVFHLVFNFLNFWIITKKMLISILSLFLYQSSCQQCLIGATCHESDISVSFKEPPNPNCFVLYTQLHRVLLVYNIHIFSKNINFVCKNYYISFCQFRCKSFVEPNPLPSS